MMEKIVPAAIAALIALAGQFVLYWLTRKKIQEIHLMINSRLDAWIKAASGLARSEGFAAGQKEERDTKV